MSHRVLLTDTLSVAVPMCLTKLDTLDDTQRKRTLKYWRSRGVGILPYFADGILYRVTTKPVPTHKAFVALAQGLAALAVHPGGVCAFGRIWCAQHHPAGIAAEQWTQCPRCLGVEPDPPSPDEQRPVVTLDSL
jgi:hypothetical protein